MAAVAVSRIDSAFAELRRTRRTGLITYVTAGDPDLDRSAGILTTLAHAGSDLIEVGVPFSDPLADGPVIQRASERALAAGATMTTTLELIARVRADVAVPIVAFTYANPVLRMGIEAFAERAAAAGVDGVLILDLPIEEAGPVRAVLERVALDQIFLLSPTTTTERIGRAAKEGRGFLYGISRLGVTGARDRLADGAEALVGRIRAVATLPIALGFGISRPEHVVQVGRWADAAVVGSALVNVIADAGPSPDLQRRVEDYVGWLKSGA